MSYSAADTRHTDYTETERGLAVPNKSTNYHQKKMTQVLSCRSVIGSQFKIDLTVFSHSVHSNKNVLLERHLAIVVSYRLF